MFNIHKMRLITDSSVSSSSTGSIMLEVGGTSITTGVKSYTSVNFNCTITGWRITSDASCSIVVDVWKDTYSNFPPTNTDSIAGSELPTLSSAVKNEDLTLTTWTTSVTSGDVIGFNIDSITQGSATKIKVELFYTK